MIANPHPDTSGPLVDGPRALIDTRLSPPLSNDEYELLELQGVLAELEAADEKGRAPALRKAATLVLHFRKVRGEPTLDEPTKQADMVTDDRDRRYALSRLLAIEAGRSLEVRGFRERHLGGPTLKWEALEGWIQARVAAEGTPSQYAEVELPEGATLRVTPEGTYIESATALKDVRVEGRVSAKLLKYGVPGGKWVQAVGTKRGGVLDELRRLSEKLSREYSWTMDQATVFVLTDVTPYMVGIRQETSVQTEHPAASKIRLEIDPIVAPVEALNTYSSLRQKMLQGTYRPLKQKYLDLAVFAAERRPEAKWAEIMKAWNAEHPKDAYEVETIFARDCTQAQKRLLRPRLDEDALL